MAIQIKILPLSADAAKRGRKSGLLPPAQGRGRNDGDKNRLFQQPVKLKSWMPASSAGMTKEWIPAPRMRLAGMTHVRPPPLQAGVPCAKLYNPESRHLPCPIVPVPPSCRNSSPC